MKTKFEVTLKQLREHQACISGYNKVVSALKEIEYDYERETYIRFKHNEPISLITILKTNGLDDALWCLRCNDKEWARDSRLFAVWCARQVQHLMTDKRSINALDVAEKYANGEATESELAAAMAAAMAAARDAAMAAARATARATARDTARATARAAAWGTALDAAWDTARAAAWDTARAAAWDTARAAAWDTARAAALDAQKEMFIKMCNGEAPWQKEVAE